MPAMSLVTSIQYLLVPDSRFLLKKSSFSGAAAGEGGQTPHCMEPAPFNVTLLLEQLQDELRLCVRLSKHRDAALYEDLVLGEFNHFCRHIRIANTGVRRQHIFI